MSKLKPRQLRILADFSNYIAVAWFTAGVVTPILSRSDSFLQYIKIPMGGIVMTTIFLYFSLAIAKKSSF